MAFLSYNNKFVILDNKILKYPAPSFGNGFNNSVLTIAIDQNNKMYVGGLFSSYNDVSVPYIVRLNTDGTIDPTFDTGTGFNGYIRKIKIDPQDNTKIYVCGAFTKYKDVSEGKLTRLNYNGSKDTSFNIGAGFGSPLQSDSLYDFDWDSSNRIVVVGHFHNIQGDSSTQYIARLQNGLLDKTFNQGSGIGRTWAHPNTYEQINTVFIDPYDNENHIYIGGDFDYWKDDMSRSIVKINQDGSINNMFNVLYGWPYYIFKIYKDNLDRLLVGGWSIEGYYDSSYSEFEYFPRKSFTALNKMTYHTEGSFDAGSGIGGAVYDILQDRDNAIYVSGSYSSYKDIPVNNSIIKLDVSGNTLPFNAKLLKATEGAATEIYTIALDSNNNVYLGGNFVTYDNKIQNRIIKLDPSGNKKM